MTKDLRLKLINVQVNLGISMVKKTTHKKTKKKQVLLV